MFKEKEEKMLDAGGPLHRDVMWYNDSRRLDQLGLFPEMLSR